MLQTDYIYNDLMKDHRYGISNITLISSESCSLHCDYCTIANCASSSHKEEIQNIRKAFEDGSFINNIAAIFKRFDLDPNQVTKFDMWGQEPSLTLDVLIPELPHLLKEFPNIQSTFFSSNMMQYPERTIEFAKAIDDLNIQNFVIGLQFSYDGEYSTVNYRHADPETIKANIKYIIKELNNIEWKNNISFDISIHGVVSPDTIKYIYDNDKFEEYWLEFINLEKECTQLITKPIVNSFNYCPGLMTPYDATKEEGQLLAKFFRDCIRRPIGFWGNFSHPPLFEGILQILGGETLDYLKDSDYLNAINNLYTCRFQDANSHSSMGCSVGKGTLKLRYNGQLVFCQNAIFDLSEEDIRVGGNDNKDLYLALLKEPSMYPNLLTSSDEDIDKFLYRWSCADKNRALPHVFTITLNLMSMLAAAGQIDGSYKTNYEKLVKHAFIIANTSVCWDASLRNTGSPYGRLTGWIRFLANGMADILQDFIDSKFERPRLGEKSHD